MTSQQIQGLATQEHDLILDLKLESKEVWIQKQWSGIFKKLHDLWKLWIKIYDVRFYNPEVNVQPHSNLKSLNLNIWENIPRLRSLPLNRDCNFIGNTKTLTPICESSTFSGASESLFQYLLITSR